MKSGTSILSHRSPAQRLFSAVAVRALDRRAIDDCGIPAYTLMRRAAAAAWRAADRCWPQTRRVIVVCGAGNNGGDGYEIARLARASGRASLVIEPLQNAAKGDALNAREAYCAGGGEFVERIPADCGAGDLVVDALFGIGLSRAPESLAGEAIAAINAARERGAEVLAVDLPSGLAADTGATPGAVVNAGLTVTFIGLKAGLYTGEGPAVCGRIVFDDLGVPASVYKGAEWLAELLDASELRLWLAPRPRTAHKGDHGHVLVIGGDHGYGGAALLCARAALRAGAGLVSVATRTEHARAFTAAQPELMCHAVESASDLAPLLERADAIAVGPGLAKNAWGRSLLAAVDTGGKPQVADADALNVLAESPHANARRVLTPHPGEAARLLGCTTGEVQADRFAAARSLQARYGGVAVLKGAGSLVCGRRVQVCPYGNPGMAVGGMGDALTGIIAAFLAQGMEPEGAANAAVLAHALAGDRAAAAGERGLLPGDLIDALRTVVNP